MEKHHDSSSDLFAVLDSYSRQKYQGKFQHLLLVSGHPPVTLRMVSIVLTEKLLPHESLVTI